MPEQEQWPEPYLKAFSAFVSDLRSPRYIAALFDYYHTEA